MTASIVLFFAGLLAMLGVLASLMFGIFAMTGEGEDKRLKSNKMMQMRVWLQGLAILLLFLSYAAK
jgi:hypothetical protein